MRSEKGRREPNPSVLGGPRVLHTDTDGDSLALTAGALLTGLIVICTLRKGTKKHGQSGTEPTGTRLDTLTPRKAITARYQAHQLATESATTRRLEGKTRPERFTLREWHGVELRKPDWASWSHTLAWSLHDPHHGPLLWCGMNAYGKAMHFDLPPCPAGWMRVIDTALPAGLDLPARPERWSPTGAPLESRSLMLMLAAPLVKGLRLKGR